MLRADVLRVVRVSLWVLLASPTAAALAQRTPASSLEQPNREAVIKGDGHEPHPVSDVLLAARLARLGERTRDPLALIVAARVLQAAGAGPLPTSNAADRPAAGAAARPTAISAGDLLGKARTLAQGRPDLLALAAEVEQSRPRGLVGGPKVEQRVIRSGETRVYEFEYRGGVEAVVGITGDGAADLDLLVVDERGARVCLREGESDDEICRFTPRHTAIFKVVVRNVGKVANQYLLVSN